MIIRKAIQEDIDCLEETYSISRKFMRATGNQVQWIDGYPSRELILKGIEGRKQFVCVIENQIVGTFYFCVEEEITYNQIYEGEWINNKAYGVVHRLASNGIHKGIAAFCLQWCFNQCQNIRVDTHRDNKVMQHILKKENYLPCGIIYVSNGTERLAFQKC